MVEQRDAAWVAAASPEDRVRALNAGELATYLGGRTEAEQAQEAHVNASPDRLLAEAYGFASAAQMVSVGNSYGSTLFESKRRDMTPAQAEKLVWLESATPAEAYAAEQAGELDNLLGRDVKNEAARLDAIAGDVDRRLRAALFGTKAR